MSSRLRLARTAATLSALTTLALLSGVAPAAADEQAAHPLAVLTPFTGAFAENGEATPIDKTLDSVVPQEAGNVIGPALDQVDTALGQRGQDDSHSEELVLECSPDTGTCDEVERPAPTAPRG